MNKNVMIALVIAIIGLYSCNNSNQTTLRLMNYNVHNGAGVDDTTDLVRIAKLINQYTPDVVALQELDSVTNRSAGVYLLGEIAKETSMYPTFGAAIDFDGGKYGIGILSKERPISHKVIALPGVNERRALLVVEFENYVVCCTHLALTVEDRLQSIDIIYDAVSTIDKPLFLAGDMNSLPDSPEQIKIAENFTLLNDVTQNTYPSESPDSCIDYIYQFKNQRSAKVTESKVIENCLFSDHLPMFVEISL